jgi:predicted esterase
LKVETKYLKVLKSARYVTSGILSEKTRYIWIAMHGSHMVCEQMISKLKDFDPVEHFVVAPEGLSRFYAKGFSGEVVSTWMTSRDRLQEIEDFSNYLTALYHLFPIIKIQPIKTILLGFSQGGTSAFRWLHAQNIDFDYFIAYACWIPEDIDLAASASDLNKMDIIYTYGDQDEFINTSRIESLSKIIAKNKLQLHWESYAGTHRVDKKQLRSLFEKYIGFEV